jgi:hypothetical protein
VSSQIFLEVDRDRPRSSGLRPSIELAHGYRTADISARARPQERETPGSEFQGRQTQGSSNTPEAPLWFVD